jgi:drug/metabolite transporter (DMT)-like permease
MSLLAKISTDRDARLAGIGLMLLGVFMFSLGDALGKFLVSTYAVGQLLAFRACAALVLLSPLIWRHRGEFARLQRPRLELLRVFLSTLEVAAFFLATVYLPLADVTTYYLACPNFVTALSGGSADVTRCECRHLSCGVGGAAIIGSSPASNTRIGCVW